MKNTILLILLMISLSCLHQNKDVPTQNNFNTPIIQQSKSVDTIEYFKAEHISDSRANFACKNRFGDTLKIPIKGRTDTSYHVDFLDVVKHRHDPFKSDGLELFADYKTDISRIGFIDGTKEKYFYPLYVVNQTQSTKVYLGYDKADAIQEAMDPNGDWRPIDGISHSRCGYGDWAVKIHPKEFLTFLIPKYQGDYKTKLRVRIRIGDIIYVSNPFEGRIDPCQFYFNKQDGYYFPFQVQSPYLVQHQFLGSMPIELEDPNFGRR